MSGSITTNRMATLQFGKGAFTGGEEHAASGRETRRGKAMS